MLGLNLAAMAFSKGNSCAAQNNFSKSKNSYASKNVSFGTTRTASTVIRDLFDATCDGRVIYALNQNGLQILIGDVTKSTKKTSGPEALLAELRKQVKNGKIKMELLFGNLLHVTNPNPKDGVNAGFKLALSNGRVQEERSFIVPMINTPEVPQEHLAPKIK